MPACYPHQCGFRLTVLHSVMLAPTCCAAVGCGQWQLQQGSGSWTCYVNDPAQCAEGAALAVDSQQQASW